MVVAVLCLRQKPCPHAQASTWQERKVQCKVGGEWGGGGWWVGVVVWVVRWSEMMVWSVDRERAGEGLDK